MKKVLSLLLVLSLVASQLFSMPFREINPDKVLDPFQKKTLNSLEKETTKLETYSPVQSQSLAKQSIPSKIQSKDSEISEEEMNNLIDLALTDLDNAKSTTIEAKDNLIAAAAKVKENSEQIKILKDDSKNKDITISDLTDKNGKLEKSISKKDGQIKVLNKKLNDNHFFSTIGTTYNLEEGFGIGFNLGYTFGMGGIINCGLSAPINTFSSPLKMANLSSYTASVSIGWIW